MTTTPFQLAVLGSYLGQNGAVNLGIVGDMRHCRGYHLGRDRIFSTCACKPDGTCEPGAGANDYSVKHARDKNFVTNAASAIDIGKVGGTLAGLQKLSRWLVAECQRGAPDTRDIREIIYSPDGTNIRHWDTPTQKLYVGGTGTGHGDNSHRTHTHVSFFRDSEDRDKTALFRRYFEEEDMDDRIIPEARCTVKAGPVFRDAGLTQQLMPFLTDVTNVQLYGRSPTFAAIRVDLASGDAEDIHVGYVPIARVTVFPSFTQADVEAARAAGYASAKTKASAAVSAI